MYMCVYVCMCVCVYVCVCVFVCVAIYAYISDGLAYAWAGYFTCVPPLLKFWSFH